MKGSSRSRPGARPLLIGVVALLSAGVGTVVLTNAAGSDGSSSFVPITPCRLMDTRSTSQIGPRGTPIGASELYAPMVWGSNGNCIIPTSATAVSLNVTFVSPTSAGFVAVFPPDKPNPGTSNLNFVAGQPPAPNGVTSPLSFDGKIGFFNQSGTVNLIADIVGYYEQAGSAPGGIVAGNCSAILRWDLPECQTKTFATGREPIGVAFDGSNLWVSNFFADTVSKINPVTGAKVDFPTLDGPTGVAFDGSSIWVTNFDSDKVSKFNPATGTKVDFETGDGPNGVTFDGTSIWVVNQLANTVSKMNPVTGAIITSPGTGSSPRAVVFDGSHIFVANFTGSTITKINPATGLFVSTFGTSTNPTAIAFDGTYLWITSDLLDQAVRMNPANGATTTMLVGDRPRGVAFDGTNIWVANFGDDTVSKINPRTAVVLATYSVGDEPSAMAFDGSNIWVTISDDDMVMKLVP